MKVINKKEFEHVLNEFEKFNFDDCLESSLYADYNQVWFHKGFQACIECLKEYYNIETNIDIINMIKSL